MMYILLHVVNTRAHGQLYKSSVCLAKGLFTGKKDEKEQKKKIKCTSRNLGAFGSIFVGGNQTVLLKLR